MKDPKLSLCTSATRGIWMDLLCAMHEADRSGELRGTTVQLARLARCSTVELEAALTDLQLTGAADVEQRNEAWVVANRRMRREAVTREKRALAGSKGGSKTQEGREPRPDTDNDIDCLKIISEYCISLGLPCSDGEAVFNKWQGNGWTNRGEPIRDWKATIRSWKLQGYMPSQRKVLNNGAPSSTAGPRTKPPQDIPPDFPTWFIEEYPNRRDELSAWVDFNKVPFLLRDGYWKWKKAV